MWGLGAGPEDSAPAPLGGSSLLDECRQLIPLSPASVSPPDTCDTHLTGWGGFGGPSLGFLCCWQAAEPFQPAWSAEGCGQSLRLPWVWMKARHRWPRRVSGRVSPW